VQMIAEKGFEAYLIGGCTRDLIIGRKPKDWDITTNARPDQIIEIFPKTFYENTYGTVGVVNENGEDPSTKIVEVTPYRLEASYSDKRRPDSIEFSEKLEDDLKRRDFTINAIAIQLRTKKNDAWACEVVDLFGGIKDLKNGLVKTVGDPRERFFEDALRVLRAIRIAVELDFEIETETEKAIAEYATHLTHVSTERLRDEFTRILMSDKPSKGIKMARNMGILKFIAPELEAGIGIKQNQAHLYDVWEHLLRTVDHAAKKTWSLDIRLAALLHDISKPATRVWSDEKKDWTFYGHEVVGAKVAKDLLTRLKYPKETIDKVIKLVRWHMFFSDTEQISLSAVRRMIRNVGPENVWDLMNVRICDRVGIGRPKEDPYRLRKYKSMVEEALRDPISVGMLKIDGKKIMELTQEPPGPKVGHILHALLEEVLEDPTKNSVEYLNSRVQELSKLETSELKRLGESGKERKDTEDEKKLDEIRKKYWVR